MVDEEADNAVNSVTDTRKEYQEFLKRLTLFVSKNPDLMTMTLGNIFTMRLIGNKTHGDMAEIAISEFINQYMYDFSSKHVGKDLFRAKEHEEDITVVEALTKKEIPISLKAYGVGPLQLSTDKNERMFPRLEQEGDDIRDRDVIDAIFSDDSFTSFQSVNVMPLIYDEKHKRCNIMIFDYDKAKRDTAFIVKETAGSGRLHPVYRFFDANSQYICEVRYGGASANALQRGLWTNTKTASQYFTSITGGWITYAENMTLLELFSHALVSSQTGHQKALEAVEADIQRLKKAE
ncbi:SspI [Bifidobacterium biavatii DSM 23969]|uniref:SspI n=2 Tax=Bifidobacterium biavatii TaxID=762212 RepID=A0A086ZNF9_9BIFI|nr:SspI [Bifidobacterium biavatii DSM 23969]